MSVLACVPDSASVDVPNAAHASPLALVPPPGPPTKSILLVEDDEDDAFIVQMGLRKVDPSIRVEVVSDYAAALFAMRTGDYDAAVVDYRLGSKTGVELIERCRAGGTTIPVILLTGQGGVDVDAEAMRRGASAYLSKAEMTPELLERSLRYAVERSANEAELVASQRRYEAALTGSSDGIWDWDVKSAALFLSPRFKQMLGFADDALPSTRAGWFSRIHQDDRSAVEASLREHARGQTEALSVEYRAQHQSGEWLWMHLRGKLQRNPDGVGIRIAGSQSEITERKEAEDQNRYRALHDALTGLANRALFSDRLEHAVQRMEREEDYGFTLLYLDLDNFKPINDRFGHAAGDVVLMETAARLRDAVRAVDTVARMGGDEFVVILERCVRPEHAAAVAAHVESVVTQPVEVPEGRVTPGVSIGVHTVTDAGVTSMELLGAADHAMYRAKISRRTATPLRVLPVASRAAASLQGALAQALETGLVHPHFQAIVQCRSGAPAGFEALARWTDDTRGPVSPAQFVPAAETGGLMRTLGRSMLAQGCSWAAQRSDAPTISVNISPSHLASPHFVGDVEEALGACGLPGDRLILELTEHTAMVDEARTLQSLSTLGDRGVRLALDDFGTGFCAVSLLVQLPVSIIKLDRSLMMGVDADPKRLRIVRHLTEMAHSLGVQVTAEGIETQGEWTAAIGQCVDHAQGFFFARPCAEPALP